MKEIIVNSLIESIEKEMKNYNKEAERDYEEYGVDKTRINIPNCLAVFEQHLDDYSELISDLEKYDWWINIEESDEDDCINYIIRIDFQEASDDDIIDEYDGYYDAKYANFHYDIELYDTEVYSGYCECTEEDEGYDARYHCCGYGCDWYCPTFSVKKVIELGSSQFNGYEHDLWDYCDEYYGVTVKEKEEKQKREKRKRIEEQIKSLQKELEELDKE